MYRFRCLALFLYAEKSFFVAFFYRRVSSSSTVTVAGVGSMGEAGPTSFCSTRFIIHIQNAAAWQQSRSVVTAPGPLLGIRFSLRFQLLREALLILHSFLLYFGLVALRPDRRRGARRRSPSSFLDSHLSSYTFLPSCCRWQQSRSHSASGIPF